MKNKLQTLLPSTVPSPLFTLTCVLLLLLGGACWAATDKIAREADAAMEALVQPTTHYAASMPQTR